MSEITIVQLLRKENLDYQKIVTENSFFLKSMGVEYVLYDQLKSFEILKFIKNVEKIKYFRKEFKNLKTSLLESGLLTNGKKIIYLKSDDILTIENVEYIEKARPNIMRNDLKNITNLPRDNFKFSDFNLFMKEKKTIWEKIKLFFI